MRASLLAALLFASPAAGLSIVPNPVSFSGGGMSGSMSLVEVTTGLPAGGIVLDGTVGASDIVLVLQGRLDSGSGDALAIAAAVQTGGAPLPDVPVAGIGWISGPDTDVTSGFILGGIEAGFFVGLSGGEQADRIWLAYAGPLATDGSLELLVGSSANLSEPAGAVGVATIVPEPAASSLAPFWIGVALLAIRGRS